MSLRNEVALVSGSGRGIGRAVAEKLAAEGARVVVNDLDEGPAKETVSAIEAAGGTAVACAGSVTDTDFADRFVGTAVEAFGGVDIIVNNAGYVWNSFLRSMTDEQWSAILDVHLTAPFRILRAAQPVISSAVKKEQAEGTPIPTRKVVNVSSIVGTAGSPSQVNYASAKSGLLGMTRTLAQEWGRYRVNVNSVAFGIIDTRLTRPEGSDSHTVASGERLSVAAGEQELAVLERGAAAAALPRPGTSQEAAGSVWMMCAPEADYITGHVLFCSGGLTSVG